MKPMIVSTPSGKNVMDVFNNSYIVYKEYPNSPFKIGRRKDIPLPFKLHFHLSNYTIHGLNKDFSEFFGKDDYLVELFPEEFL